MQTTKVHARYFVRLPPMRKSTFLLFQVVNGFAKNASSFVMVISNATIVSELELLKQFCTLRRTFIISSSALLSFEKVDTLFTCGYTECV